MLHYTLNTGHTRICSRQEVRDDVLEFLRPMCEPGRHDLPLPDWQVRTSPRNDRNLTFTVFKRDTPIVTCDLAANDDAAGEVWQATERFYLRVSELPDYRGLDWEMPRQPPKTPWLAAIMLKASSTCRREPWLGDFETYLAHAWLHAVRTT